MRFAPRSLRARITVGAVCVVGLVLATAAVLVVILQRDQLVDNIDDALEREVADLVAALNADPNLGLGERDSDRFVQMIAADGSIAATSPNLAGAPALVDVNALEVDEDGAGLFTSSSIPIEDDEFRVLARPVDVRGESVVMVVGENTDDLRDSLWTLAGSLAVMVPLATAILGGLAWLLVGRTLKPVASIQRQVGHITLNRLGERVEVPDTHDEIAALATTMNEMLDRLDQANERQQHFVADASHELRSPLTRLRPSLEVDLGDPERDLNQTGHELVQDLDDLQRLVNDLLFLARTREQTDVEMERVDLDAVVDQVVEHAREGAVHLDTRAVEAVEVRGNESHLSRLVNNLVANAIRYARSTIWISAGERDAYVTLVVDDDGPGIPEADRSRVFERFTRLDDSRTGATGGTGLGLAIAREIAATHGGSIRVEQGRTGGAKFIVNLPAWNEADQSSV